MKNSKNQFKVNEQALINDILTNGKQGRAWYDLAVQYNIRPNGCEVQRRKSANDIWRRYNKLNDNSPLTPLASQGLATPSATHVTIGTTPIWQMPHYFDTNIIGPGPILIQPQVVQEWKPKRLFYDIETSYNIVKAWRAGYNLTITPEDIIHERAIISIAYKWEGEDDVTVLTWNKGCDKNVITEFVKVMGEADELVGHNIDRFDTKFVMGRALKHGILGLPKYQSTDTLKLARKHFMLNSNKLDYIAQFLGIGSKTKHRGMSMWDDIILRNDKNALEEMVEYNIQDVHLTEKVYKKLTEYSLPKVNHTSKQTGVTHACPECGNTEATLEKTYVSPSGSKTRLMSCNSCETNFTVNNTNYKKHYESNEG